MIADAADPHRRPQERRTLVGPGRRARRAHRERKPALHRLDQEPGRLPGHAHTDDAPRIKANQEHVAIHPTSGGSEADLQDADTDPDSGLDDERPQLEDHDDESNRKERTTMCNAVRQPRRDHPDRVRRAV